MNLYEERKSDLLIPKNKQNYYEIYTINKGDSLYSIARKYNINPELLASLNGISMEDYIYPNEQILIPMEGVEIYVTRDNDTLNNILNTIGITANELVKQNDKLFLLPDQLVVYKKEKSF